jgi:hypothetical protein
MAPDGLFVVAEDIGMPVWRKMCVYISRKGFGGVRNMLEEPICVAGNCSTKEQSFYLVFDRL